MRKVRFWFRYQRKKIRIIIIKFGRAFKRESKETVVAAKILKRLIQDEDSVSEEEIRFLKGQGADLGKAVGLLGLQLVPGSSIGIIALEKVGKKKGFSVFPQENELPTSSKDSPSS
jgi:hypothetical protein